MVIYHLHSIPYCWKQLRLRLQLIPPHGRPPLATPMLSPVVHPEACGQAPALVFDAMRNEGETREKTWEVPKKA